jgi:hypothetical protein
MNLQMVVWIGQVGSIGQTGKKVFSVIFLFQYLLSVIAQLDSWEN